MQRTSYFDKRIPCLNVMMRGVLLCHMYVYARPGLFVTVLIVPGWAECRFRVLKYTTHNKTTEHTIPLYRAAQSDELANLGSQTVFKSCRRVFSGINAKILNWRFQIMQAILFRNERENAKFRTLTIATYLKYSNFFRK